jgi:hypothetical protein
LRGAFAKRAKAGRTEGKGRRCGTNLALGAGGRGGSKTRPYKPAGAAPRAWLSLSRALGRFRGSARAALRPLCREPAGRGVLFSGSRRRPRCGAERQRERRRRTHPEARPGTDDAGQLASANAASGAPRGERPSSQGTRTPQSVLAGRSQGLPKGASPAPERLLGAPLPSFSRGQEKRRRTPRRPNNRGGEALADGHRSKELLRWQRHVDQETQAGRQRARSTPPPFLPGYSLGPRPALRADRR